MLTPKGTMRGPPARAHSVVEDELLRPRPARAAVVLGPVVGQPALGLQDGVPLLLIGLGQALPGLDLPGDARRQLALQEGAHGYRGKPVPAG